MNEILDTWHLPALALLFVCGVGLGGTFLLDRTLARLNGEIASPGDLDLLRRAINVNMKLAVLVILLMVAYWAVLGWHFWSGYIGFNVLSLYLLVAGLPLYGLNSVYIKKVETRARNLPVSNYDPQLSATYRSFIEQWSKAGLSVS